MPSSRASSLHRSTGAASPLVIDELDPRAQRGIDQALRLAVGALRVPLCLVAFQGTRGPNRPLRMAESGAWAQVGDGGSATARSIAEKVANAADAQSTTTNSVIRGRTSVEALGTVEYVAFPVVVNGSPVGIFSVVDRRQRDWGPEQESMLRDIVGVVAGEVEWYLERERGSRGEGRDRLAASLLEVSGEGIVAFDTERRCRLWNPFMERLTSREASEIVGAHASAIESLLRIPDLDLLITRALVGESTTTADQLFQPATPHSDPRYISARVSPLRSGAGPVSGVVVIVSDTTSAMTAERRRQRGEEMFRRLIEHSTELLTVIAPDGTVLFDGLANERIMGYGPDELLGRRLFEIVHPDDVSHVVATIDRIGTEEPKTATVEYRLRHKNGTWRRVLSTCRNLSDDPFVHGIVLNSRDITEWRAMEEQLHESQRMDALGRLAGGIAHDFNNLLTAIKGNVQLLLMDSPPGAAGREELEEINRVSDRAAQLTKRLLAFGRRSGRPPGAVDVADVVDGTTRMLERLLGGVRLEVRCDEGCVVRTDSTRLEQVIMNLVLNSRDAMPNGGTVNLEVQHAELPPDLTLAQPDAAGRAFVRLRVSDTGEGMDAATREQIFEPFFTTKPAGHGTGLGLPTVYAIVRQSGGHIAVHSVRGEGTRFDVYLPAADGEVATIGAMPS